MSARNDPRLHAKLVRRQDAAKLSEALARLPDDSVVWANPVTGDLVVEDKFGTDIGYVDLKTAEYVSFYE